MADAQIHSFSEDIETMTVGEARNYIERTRRQLDRLPLMRADGKTIDPESEAKIRRLCDQVEAAIGKND